MFYFNTMNERRNQKSTKCCGTHYMKTVEKYCVSCKKNTAYENSSVRKIKQTRLMLLSDSAVCGKKKARFIKNQELHLVVFNNFNKI